MPVFEAGEAERYSRVVRYHFNARPSLPLTQWNYTCMMASKGIQPKLWVGKGRGHKDVLILHAVWAGSESKAWLVKQSFWHREAMHGCWGCGPEKVSCQIIFSKCMLQKSAESEGEELMRSWAPWVVSTQSREWGCLERMNCLGVPVSNKSLCEARDLHRTCVITLNSRAQLPFSVSNDSTTDSIRWRVTNLWCSSHSPLAPHQGRLPQQSHFLAGEAVVWNTWNQCHKLLYTPAAHPAHPQATETC